MSFQTCCFGKLLQFAFGQCPLHAGFGEVVGRFPGQQGQYPRISLSLTMPMMMCSWR